MFRLFCLFLVFACATAPALSATNSKHPSTYKKPVKKKPQVQQHYSFIPPKQPIEAIEKLKESSLSKGVVIHQEETPKVTSLPSFKLSVLSPTAPMIIEKLEPTNIITEQAEVPQPIRKAKKKKHQETVANNPESKHKSDFLRPFKKLSFKLPHGKINPGIQERSSVSGINEEQSRLLAASIAASLAQQIPPASTLILLAPLKRGHSHNPLTPALNDSLRKAGFGLVESKSQAPNAQVLQYQVNRQDNGIWVQVQFNHSQGNQYFALNGDNSLSVTGPISVREIKNNGL